MARDCLDGKVIQGMGIIRKIKADHGQFPSRPVKGNQRECVMCGGTCGEKSMYDGPQECHYCPERVYCSELCQARDWPEHKKNCKMGNEGTGSKVREVQVLKDTRKEPGEEPKRPGVVRCFKIQGTCVVCYRAGG